MQIVAFERQLYVSLFSGKYKQKYFTVSSTEMFIQYAKH